MISIISTCHGFLTSQNTFSIVSAGTTACLGHSVRPRNRDFHDKHWGKADFLSPQNITKKLSCENSKLSYVQTGRRYACSMEDEMHSCWLPAPCHFLAWLTLQPWRWRRYVPLNRQLTFTGLWDIISQKIGLFSQSYWVFGLCPSSGIIKTREHNVSETGFVSVLRWGWRNQHCWTR
jgi:hypothetical protein